jgi:hypothetical protein
LISLREGEQLFLEVSEDFTTVGASGVTDWQIKHSQAATGPPSLSLQSAEVSAVLQRYWEGSQQGSQERRVVFVARGGATAERGHTFPGGASGLSYWQAAAIDADTQPIRAALLAILPESSLYRWIGSNPSDEKLRSLLLRRVQWQLSAASVDGLSAQLIEQAGELLHASNLPIIAAAQAVKSLLDLAFATAARPNAEARRLTRRDLDRAIQEAASVNLVAERMTLPIQVKPDADQGVLVSELAERLALVAPRADTVDHLLAQGVGQPLLWLHGANGTGKSTLARLLAGRLGGRWLELDLRAVQADQSGSLAAWRELLRIMTLTSTPDGIIIDDLDGAAADALRSRLSALVYIIGARGGRVIVTSHHQPSPARLADCGVAASACIQTPYLTQPDVAALVGMEPAPRGEMVLAWSHFIHLTTRGGHPLLAAAKVASLRARGWPNDALTEDIVGGSSEAIRLSQDEARRALLSDLKAFDAARSLDATQLLRRIAVIFDRVDDGLIRRLATASPTLPHAGDALAVLRGTWLETLPNGDLRISPLLANMTEEIGDAEQRGWRGLAAKYWLGTGVLNERTLPLCFWNAFLGGHTHLLMRLCNYLNTAPRETLRRAAAVLSPITALPMDRQVIEADLAIAAQVRLLQFEVADALEDGKLAATIARRLKVEVEGIAHADLRALEFHVCSSKVLMAEFAEITPAERISWALGLRVNLPKLAAVRDDEVPDPQPLLPSDFRPDMDLADLLFASITRHIKNSNDERETFKALDCIDAVTRNRFIDAMSIIYEGPAVFVHSGWSRDQLDERDMHSALDCYTEIDAIAAGWMRPDLLIEIICARSVILDEGLKNLDEAVAVIDRAIAVHGVVPALLRQKSKVLGHAGRDAEAINVLLQVEDEVGNGSSFDRGLALREGAISAARAERFEDAARLFGKSHDAMTAAPGREALSAALIIEKALVLWRAGKRSDAILTAADALDAVEAISSTDSRQGERSHQYARALVGLFFREIDGPPAGPVPFTFGQSSSLESDSTEILCNDLKPLADNWRILAVVEAGESVDVGIDARSMKKQAASLVVSTEALLSRRRYISALRTGSIADALYAGAIMMLLLLAMRKSRDGDGALARMPITELELIEPKELVATSAGDEGLLGVVLDIALHRAFVTSYPVDNTFFDELRQATEGLFGYHESIGALIDTAAGRRQPTSGDRAAIISATAFAISPQRIEESPAERIYRDALFLQALTTSMAQNALICPFASKLRQDWKRVIASQRFMLRNPMVSVPPLEVALFELAEPTLQKAATLILAAAPAVGPVLSDAWQEYLERLASGHG